MTTRCVFGPRAAGMASAVAPVRPALAHRFRWLPAAAAVAGALALAACTGSETGSGAPPAEQAAQSVGYVVLHPQAAILSSNVAGRVVALQTAEIRPQVAGLVIERVFKEGGQVKTGDVLYRIDPESYEASVESAKATLEKAEAALLSAKAKTDRYANLTGSRVVSEQDQDSAQSSYLQAVAEVAVAKAALRTAQINLDKATITAPIDGEIGTSSVNVGALVTASQTTALATIRQIDPVYVDLTETSGNLLRFRDDLRAGNLTPLAGPGTRSEVRLSFTNGTDYPVVGTIDAAEQYVSQTTSSFTIRARFPNPDRLLLPGMYVLATVALASDNKAFLVPQRAVSRNAKGEATAWFVGNNNTAELRVLQTSANIGRNWLVSAGVADGDRLIVDGLQRVQAGAAVKGVETRLTEDGQVEPVAAAASAAKASGAATLGSVGTSGSGSGTEN